MTIVVLAAAADGEALAQRVCDGLARAGFSVRRGGAQLKRRVEAAALETAQRVVVIWSRAARGSPVLRAAVRRARARGTLVCVPLGAAPPPPGAKTLTHVPKSGAAWRRALELSGAARSAPAPRAYARPARARRDPALRVTREFAMTPVYARRRGAPIFASIAALLLIAAAFGAEAANADASFGARVNAWASTVSEIVASLAR